MLISAFLLYSCLSILYLSTLLNSVPLFSALLFYFVCCTIVIPLYIFVLFYYFVLFSVYSIVFFPLIHSFIFYPSALLHLVLFYSIPFSIMLSCSISILFYIVFAFIQFCSYSSIPFYSVLYSILAYCSIKHALSFLCWYSILFLFYFILLHLIWC